MVVYIHNHDDDDDGYHIISDSFLVLIIGTVTHNTYTCTHVQQSKVIDRHLIYYTVCR